MNLDPRYFAPYVLFACLLTTGDLRAQETGQQTKPSHALVIIDIQNFYFPNGALPLTGSLKAAERAKLVLEAFRRQNLPVVHVKHIPARDGIDPNDPQWSIHSLVHPTSSEKVVVKHHVNGFRDTPLLSIVKTFETNKLVLMGMQTHMCLEAAARAAADLGFQVTVVHDACATRDIVYEDTVVPAKLVHAETLASLKDIYAKLASSKEIIQQIQPLHVSDKQK